MSDMETTKRLDQALGSVEGATMNLRHAAGWVDRAAEDAPSSVREQLQAISSQLWATCDATRSFGNTVAEIHGQLRRAER